MTVPYTPAKEDVAAFYNAAIPLITRLAGVNVHFGYWTSPDDPASVAEATDRLTDLVLDRLGEAARVLDVGCGLGGPALRLAERTGAQVVGIATSEALIEAAAARAEAAGLAAKVSFELVDAADLPYPDGSFDAVLAIESLVHMPDRGVVFRELARVLRPGGRLALTDFYERVPLTGRRLDVVEEYRRFTLNGDLLPLGQYFSLLRESGFDPQEYRDITVPTAEHHIRMIERVDRQRAELTELYGDEMVTKFQTVFRGCLAVSEPSYMLVAARRRQE
jgi:ubiquinone/menaquinone biosynthesis C-methylase UbiE